MAYLEHRKGTVKEGVGVLFGVSATAVGMVVFMVVFFPNLWDESPWSVVAFIAVGVPIFGLGAAYGVCNIVARGTFVCRIDEHVIECVSPVKPCGGGFRIRIADITTVEKNELDEGYNWYIWENDQRHWLPSNYDNPADRFIELIKELNGDVIEIVT